MRIWGIHKKYPTMSWWRNFMGDFISFGPIVIFGCNAMHWTVGIRTKKWGSICFTLPIWERVKHFVLGVKIPDGRHLEWYFYLSPNGTPWASTFYIGTDKKEHIRAQIRKLNFGHGFNSEKYRFELRCLNEKFEWFEISDYDMDKFGYNSELSNLLR